MSARRTDGPRRGVLLALLVVALLSLVPAAASGWSVGHDDSSRLAATISPEPFKSNSGLCVYGSYPDALPDFAFGYGEEICLRRMFTFEALDALRAGDVPKAMFLASAATHFLTDNACIAHASRAWYHKDAGADPWTKFLPRKYQGVRVPYEKKDVYYPHLKGTDRDTCLVFPEPEYNLKRWREFQGSTNAYFDTMPSSRAYAAHELLRRPVDWTFSDFDQYARWYAGFIALDMLDPASLNGPQLRLRDALGMKAVCLEELINGTAQCAAYYGYLATAAKAEVRPSFNELLPEGDKLMALAATDPVVLISAQAPWPVERAAHVVAMELLRAERRFAKTRGRPEPARKVGEYVVRVSAENVLEVVQKHNAVVLLTPEDLPLAAALKAPEVAQALSGVIAADKPGGANLLVILRGASRQDALYLVDYLFDLSGAPIHGPWPNERVMAAAKDAWAGWKLLLDLRKMKGEEAVAYARKVPHSHRPAKEEAAKYREGLKQSTQKAATQEEWWSYFMLELPLPDGRRVTDMIEAGTDYSALLEIVGK